MSLAWHVRARLLAHLGLGVLVLLMGAATAFAQESVKRKVPQRADRPLVRPESTQPSQPQRRSTDGNLITAGIALVILAGATVVIIGLRKRSRRKKIGASSDAATRDVPVVPPPSRRPIIFISYRREDSADIAGRITDRLIERFGHDGVFKDVDSIPLGQDFRTYLRDAVGRCAAAVVIIGPRWLDAASGRRRLDDPRDHLRIEVESALQRNIPVIPVLVQGAVLPAEEDLPETIRPLVYRNAQPIRPDPDFASDIERLIRGIETQLRSAAVSTPPAG